MRKCMVGKYISTIVLALFSSIVLGTLINCGGSGGGSDPVGYIRIYNDLMCSDGTYFNMRLDVEGTQVLAKSGEWSPCTRFTPGSYAGTSYLTACGVDLTGNHSINLGENCTYEIVFYLSGDDVVFDDNETCAASCPNPDDSPKPPPSGIGR